MVLVSAIFLSLLLIPIALYCATLLSGRRRGRSIRALAAREGWHPLDQRRAGRLFKGIAKTEVSNRVRFTICGRGAELGDRVISVKAPWFTGILRHTSVQRTRSYLMVESPLAIDPPQRTRTPNNDVQFPRTALRSTVVISDGRLEIRSRGRRLRLREPLWSPRQFEEAVELASELIESGVA